MTDPRDHQRFQSGATVWGFDETERCLAAEIFRAVCSRMPWTGRVRERTRESVGYPPEPDVPLAVRTASGRAARACIWRSG